MIRLRVRYVHGLAAVATVAFLAVLLWYLPKPGYTPVRLLFFIVLGGLAVVGAVGVVRRLNQLTAVSIGGLFLLGFWQATLWFYIYPLIGVLTVAALVDDPKTDEQSGVA